MGHIDLTKHRQLNWEQETADLRAGSWIDSSVSDEDGDNTMFGQTVLNNTLHAVTSYPEVHGHDMGIPAGRIGDPKRVWLVNRAESGRV